MPLFAADTLHRRLVFDIAGFIGTSRPEPIDVPACQRPISGALIRELTAERTMALRIELARNPTVALAAAAHAHVLHLVYGVYSDELQTCLDQTYRPDAMTGAAPKIKESPATLELAEERDSWRAALPGDPASLWDFLMAAPIEVVLALHAFGVSQSVLAVVDVDGDRPTGRTAHAVQLAATLGLDMNAWWSLGRGGYRRRRKCQPTGNRQLRGPQEIRHGLRGPRPSRRHRLAAEGAPDANDW